MYFFIDITCYWLGECTVSKEVVDEEASNVEAYTGQKITVILKGPKSNSNTDTKKIYRMLIIVK